MLTAFYSQGSFANAEFAHAYEAAQAGDFKKAKQLWEPLAQQGIPAAQYALGWLYESGQGTTQNYSQAAHWYRKAADQGDVSAQYVLATMYEKGTGFNKDLNQAIHWYIKAAHQGDAIAQYKLGKHFQNGTGVPQSDTESFTWYNKAATQGHITAQISLGKYYQEGRGTTQDYKLAIEWYERATNQGNALAQYQLASMYEYGRGTAQSYQKARELYFKSADHYAPSAYKIAEFYQLGKTDKVDLKKARLWYKRAANKGNSAAQYKLGWIYQNGIGVKANVHTAIGWYFNAAEQDHAQATYQLGTIYDEGVLDKSENQVIAVDYYKAKEYFQKACDLDFNLAYARLANLYENGLGVKMDREHALSLYKKSKQAGDQPRFQALAKQVHCLHTATTKLFSVAIACTNRKELDQQIKAQKITAIEERKNSWSDTYFTGAIVRGSSELQVTYTNKSQFVSAQYTFVGRNNPRLIVQVKDLLSKKYGDPDLHYGDVDQGEASFTWLLDDGIELLTERSWPDTTTFVTYTFPDHLSLMDQEDQQQKKSAPPKPQEEDINLDLL